ncbi:indolepyruvate ferredoxin oxidoreductase family protein [Sulfitobacter sabulilitoris]|uniref:Indolepyruvate ferredoxin oxidoreductase family protein n=1 Tax=Sulfitobacter sabulilitoris TaxID=2562655 RepID=A0A5S3PD37_9RHOB|nr:indolepyruvate ferredoxin oxidoreductase family protein [Sulfitobacter sabulilitoris]TMM51783.1 indolepyruvate ferredoxin oxidoreductase family protein [Sulfitobacter sabulilitoris]
MTQHARRFDTYALQDRYTRTGGRVFMTGTQALVRIMLDQARRDRAAGMNTAGFVSGYRGSPLGGVDQEMWRSEKLLREAKISFLPAVNEDLGATAVLGAQQASLDPQCEVEGVFSMWYGKGPGVDRSGDAFKHGNAYGSAPRGGVLVVAGDDHGCVSSSMPHQSDVAFMSWFMPTLNPASVAEYQAYGEYGIALSRFSGTWVGFKAISETVESGRSVELHDDRSFVQPDFTAPPGGLHVREADLPSPEIETRIKAKLKAVEAFVEANPIDHAVYGIETAKFGFVSTGKGHLDLMETLRLLGVDEAACRRLGIDIYKVGMVWPLGHRDALNFVTGKREVLVIEEKRGIIESQFKEHFYDWPGRKPERMVGKHDENMNELVPWTGELSPRRLLPIVAARLNAFFPDENFVEKARALTDTVPQLLRVEGATRTPYFCSGCPHNTSTKVPDGSRAASGIGCHVMASWMNRNTVGYAQMGGEGVPWIATSMFNGGKHIFQNLGEGTWYHSGALAIRQAVAARTNITYKILYNDAVAMTGGQPVDGPVSAAAIAQACRAEGVERIALVSDDIGKFAHGDFPAGTTFDDRAALDTVQRELRDIPGVTVLIYEQTCATEKRRRRKRGEIPDPKRFVVINDLVCEGCGDCSVESNCLSVEPKETEFGTKRQINQSSCNKDFSCLNGFCPSFVTVEGATRRRKQGAGFDVAALTADLPRPDLPDLAKPYDLLVTGVGGTGVITVGAVISMAAHLEGRGSSVLDFTGFAQKFGTVLGYVRLAATPGDVHQVRIDEAGADAVIGCDMVVSSSPKASAHYRRGTRMVINRAEMPTGDLVLNRDADLRMDDRETVIAQAVGADNLHAFDANKMAEALLGDSVFANVMMMGFAWQKGLVPVSLEALHQALVLNGVAVERNQMAFSYGRIMAADPEALRTAVAPDAPRDQTLADLIDRRADVLAQSRDDAYAARFRATIATLKTSLPDDAGDALIRAAAKSLFKLMAFKDEYEVARLHRDPKFHARLAEDFEGDFKLNYHLAPPLLPLGRDARGRPNKRRFGAWMGAAFGVLARLRGVRGTWADPFARSADRTLDLALLDWYETLLAEVPSLYDPSRADDILAILRAPMDIRGYGPVRETAAETVRAQVADLRQALIADTASGAPAETGQGAAQGAG